MPCLPWLMLHKYDCFNLCHIVQGCQGKYIIRYLWWVSLSTIVAITYIYTIKSLPVYIQLKAVLTLTKFLGKLSPTVTVLVHNILINLPALATLRDTYRMISVYLTSPKVVKASAALSVACCCHCHLHFRKKYFPNIQEAYHGPVS